MSQIVVSPKITPEPKNNNTLAHTIALVASSIVTAVIVGSALRYSRYGIDVTDESFVLVWISNPFYYHVSISQFAFVYHPLFQLLGGSIAHLRQANLLITFSLALVLGNVFIKTIYGRQTIAAIHRFVISGALATASLVFLAVLPPTPSYNSLAFQALLVTVIGWLLADIKVSSESIFGWVVIGIGGWLGFMAKPTTAAGLAVCSVVYLTAAGKFSVRFWLIPMITAATLLLCSALFIDGSVMTFVNRIRVGVEVMEAMEGENAVGARVIQVNKNVGVRGSSMVILFIATALITGYALISLSKIRMMAVIGVIVAILLAATAAAITFGFGPSPDRLSRSAGLLLAVPIAAILAGFLVYHFKGWLQLSRRQWACAMVFLALPSVYGLGTNAKFWNVGPDAILFWILSGLVLIGPAACNSRFGALLLSLALGIQILTVIRIQNGIERPFRQPQPLRANDYVMDIGRPGSELILSRGFGRYFSEAIEVATRGGFARGMPMIDLTGQSPGILYALSAKSTGLPWILGGYRGSDIAAAKTLKMVPCQELASAWLLMEPDGPREISPAVVSSFGANFPTDFELVGTVNTAEGAGGYEFQRVQQFFKPVRPPDSAIAACIAERATAK